MTKTQQPLERWSIAKSTELYGIRNWGGGYFDISEEGHVIVRPHPTRRDHAFSLQVVVDGLRERGLNMPVLVRLGDILDARIREINNCFAAAIKEFGYKGEYRGVYPIKVNQQEQVIAEITRFGKQYHHGLEAGSKAELIAAISFLDDPDALLVCNGYKDEEFVDLGLYATKMGLQCVLVIETPGELSLILDRAEALDVSPILGIRMKLSTQGGGHWTESGGDRSVFGLNMSEVLDAVDLLRNRQKLDCLKLLHYHLGSQIPNIREIRAGVVEASRVYAGLVGEGAPMGILDLGGGLAVDYDGSHTNFPSSRNYSLQEYCSDLVEVIMSTLDEQDLPHPMIVTESGRALVAHHSVLLFNILDVSRLEPGSLPDFIPEEHSEFIHNMMEVAESMTQKNAQECLHDLVYYRDELRQRFKHGSVSLRERALGEKIFWHLVIRVAKLVKDRKYVPDEFEGLERALADVYYGNFSLFQSLPDSWAIDHLFPIMPIHRLQEQPTRSAVLSDITCDCDGKIDRFIDLHDIRRTLALHPLRDGEDYVLGVFLVGAYQETLGDLHNLLGDTHVVTVRFSDDGVIKYDQEVSGDSVADVLDYVEYDTRAVLNRIRSKTERAVQTGRLSVKERRVIVDAFTSGLSGYTYFEK